MEVEGREGLEEGLSGSYRSVGYRLSEFSNEEKREEKRRVSIHMDSL